MKEKAREKAIYLRKVEGLSLRQIASKLGVSKSSISGWVKSVKLNKKQTANLAMQNPASKNYKGVRVAAKINKERAANVRLNFQRVGREESHDFNLHLAGCMLFWAEGSKRKNSVIFTNTDLYMMRLFVRFLKEICLVDDTKILVTCRSHILSQHSLEEVEMYWLKALGLKNSNLRKGSMEIRIPKSKRIKCPYGICSVHVHDTKLVQRIFGSIKQYANISDANLWI